MSWSQLSSLHDKPGLHQGKPNTPWGQFQLLLYQTKCWEMVASQYLTHFSLPHHCSMLQIQYVLYGNGLNFIAIWCKLQKPNPFGFACHHYRSSPAFPFYKVPRLHWKTEPDNPWQPHLNAPAEKRAVLLWHLSGYINYWQRNGQMGG